MSPNSGSATGIPVSIIAPSLHTTLSSTFPSDSRSTCHSVPVSFDTVRLGLELWRSPTIWLIQTAPGSTDTEIQRHASLQLDHRPRSLKLMKQLTGSHCCLSECNFFLASSNCSLRRTLLYAWRHGQQQTQPSRTGQTGQNNHASNIFTTVICKQKKKVN